MSDPIKLPPPKRYMIESETSEEGFEVCTVIDVTGEEDPVYIIGHESPWIGSTLEQLKEWAREGEYGDCSYSVLLQIEALERAQENEKK